MMKRLRYVLGLALIAPEERDKTTRVFTEKNFPYCKVLGEVEDGERILILCAGKAYSFTEFWKQYTLPLYIKGVVWTAEMPQEITAAQITKNAEAFLQTKGDLHDISPETITEGQCR